MIKYAIILQQKYRCYQARKLLKRKAAERFCHREHRLLGDASFQKMVFGAVEGTLLNLVQEALHGFDLNSAADPGMPRKCDRRDKNCSSFFAAMIARVVRCGSDA